MAYPPVVPPANRTDTTPQFTNHPSDHNQISTALTEIINHFPVIEQLIDEVATYRSPQITATNHIQLEVASSVVTTNATGIAVINFNQPYTSSVLAVACNGEVGNPHVVATASFSTDSFQARVWNFVSGAAVANSTVRVNWMAIGTRP